MTSQTDTAQKGELYRYFESAAPANI